ncbi:MAG TPA: cytidylate kinase-like family protein [Ktedonobacteraceae bacterium]|nr:cytidylate kinase-like family protein [Ktedonobacteraceae bacterium]
MAHLFRGRGQTKSQPNPQSSSTQVLPETTWAKEVMPSGNPPPDKVVITIARQFGSGGTEIGHILARESNLTYLDREIIDEVARRLGVNTQQIEEGQAAGSVRHILEAIQASHLFTVNYDTFFGPDMASNRVRELAYVRLTQKVILELATQGNAVIIGRGSQFLLHNAPRTLHIYIFAPLPHRIERVMESFHLDHASAQEMIEQRDYEFDDYARRFYGFNRHQPELYHLLINTGIFSPALAADFIRQALPVAKEIGA